MSGYRINEEVFAQNKDGLWKNGKIKMVKDEGTPEEMLRVGFSNDEAQDEWIEKSSNRIQCVVNLLGENEDSTVDPIPPGNDDTSGRPATKVGCSLIFVHWQFIKHKACIFL